MGNHAQGGGVNIRQYMRGPLTVFGLAVAVIAGVLDQASKLYLLFVYDLAANPTKLGPFFDFVLTRNTGISYGLFASEGAAGLPDAVAGPALRSQRERKRAEGDRLRDDARRRHQVAAGTLARRAGGSCACR